MLAAIDPSRGLQAAILLLLWAILVKRRSPNPPDSLDALLLIVAPLVLLSPLWTDLPSPIHWDPSVNGAACVLYAWVLRKHVSSGERLANMVRIFAWFGSGYAIYFLNEGSRVDTQGTVRSSVEFANANYTGAVLAFTTACALGILLHRTPGLTRKLVYAASAAVQTFAIVETGSRSSATAVVFVAAVALVHRSSARWSSRLTAVLAIGAFPLGLFPRASELFRDLSVSISSFETFQRDDSALVDLSGRDLIWIETRRAFLESPFLGWGPDRYREAQESTHVMAHSWGLEYLASVGLIGTVLIAAVWVLAFRQGAKTSGELGGVAWRNMALVSLIPNLTLSTHQWTSWTWLVIGLMSVAHLLDSHEGGEDASPSTAQLVGSVASSNRVNGSM